MGLFRNKQPDDLATEAVDVDVQVSSTDAPDEGVSVVLRAKQDADDHGDGRRRRFWFMKVPRDQRSGDRSPRKWRRSRQDADDGADHARVDGVIAIVDSTHLTVVSMAKSKVMAFVEEECDTPQDALHGALKATRRSGRIVWAGDVAVRELASPPTELHPRMVALDQAERLARGFDRQRLAAAVDRTALSPSGGDDEEWDQTLQGILPKRKATVTGFAVGSEDGAWLRLGYHHAEMTLVYRGQTAGHRVLGPGVRRARELLQQNPLYDPDTVLQEMSRELTAEIHKTLVDWQKDLPAVKVLWAHGPGASTGRLTTHLQRDTKRRFDTPRIAHIDCGEFPQAVAEVPTALYAMGSPLLGAPQHTLRGPMRRRRITQALSVVAVALALVATWVYSERVGDEIDRRIDEARDQQRLIESRADPELESLIGQAHSAQLLMEDLADAGSPDWLAALRHFEGRAFQITRTQTSDQVTIACGSGGVVDQLNEMDAVAELIFGEGSYARVGSTISCSPTGEATYQISMGVPEGVDP